MSDLLGMVLRTGAERGGQPALIRAGDGPDRVWSWRDLCRDAVLARSAARRRGAEGPTAFLLRGNDPLSVPLLLGLMGGEGVLPVNPMLPAAACAGLLAAAGASELIFDDADAGLQVKGPEIAAMTGGRVRAVPLSEAFEGDLAPPKPGVGDRLMIHTSGSTGTPRVALHDTRRLIGVMGGWSAPLFPEALRLLSMAPLFTAAGLLGGVLFCARLGGTLILPGGDGPAGAGFRDGLPSLLDRHRPNVLFSVPTALRALIPLASRIPYSFDALLSGGMLMSDRTGSEIARGFGAPLHHVYASSEMSVMAASTYLPDGRVLGVNRPETTLVSIIDPDSGEVSDPGAGGEVHASSPLLPASGPYLDPRPGDMSPHGFRTGDYGRLDPSGRLILTGRVSDLVKYNGRRVPIGPVEEAAAEITGLPCAAVQGPDPATGEAITLFVEGDPPSDLTDRIRAVLPDPACVPRRVIGLFGIPRVGLGKPDRSALSRMARARTAEELLEAAGLEATVNVTGTLRDGFSLMVLTEATPGQVLAALSGLFQEVDVRPVPDAA